MGIHDAIKVHVTWLQSQSDRLFEVGDDPAAPVEIDHCCELGRTLDEFAECDGPSAELVSLRLAHAAFHATVAQALDDVRCGRLAPEEASHRLTEAGSGPLVAALDDYYRSHPH